MGLKRLSLDSLRELDSGLAVETFQQAVQRAVKDCLDRPAEKKARKVILQMTIVPVPVINGNTIDCDGVKGAFQCRCKVPDVELQQIDFGVQKDGNLIFNPDSPRDHRQATMLEE